MALQKPLIPEPLEKGSPNVEEKGSPNNETETTNSSIPPEQIEIIKGIVNRWKGQPEKIANDIVSALEGRDHTHIPLIVRNGENQEVVIWAKCDTGACANFITMDLVRKLKLEFNLKRLSDDEKEDIATSPRDRKGVGLIKQVCSFEDREININYLLHLDFQTGEKRKQHRSVEFEVLEIGDGFTSPAANEKTDLFLGASWLFQNEVFMLRKSYYVDPPEDLPVIETVPMQDHELTPIGRPPSGVRYSTGVPSIRLNPGPAPPRLPRGRMG